MLHLHDLRVRLQDRKNRLYKAPYSQYETELRFFLQFLTDDSYINGLLRTLDADTTVDFATWTESRAAPHEVRFPNSESARAKVCYEILKPCANDPEENQTLEWGMLFSSETRFVDILNDLTEAVVDPLVNFLHDRIDDSSSVLHLIERFKVKSEWFSRDELFRVYEQDTSVGEATLDQRLREALFDGGIDYPFSQPRGPSGDADIVALLGSDDPLVLEVKVFDPDRGRGKRNMQQGLHQVLRYSDDYNQPVGYLVVFNCSDGQLAFQAWPDGEFAVPARVSHGGKTFFVISIDIRPDRPSASRDRPATRTQIRYEELVGADGSLGEKEPQADSGGPQSLSVPDAK